MAAAEPHHLRRHAVGLEDLVVGDRLVEREQRVRGALDEEGRDRDLLDEVARAAAGEPGAVLGAQRAGGGAGGERGGDVRVQAVLGGRRCRRRTSSARPAALDRLLLVERGRQAVPGDDRGDRVDALVARRGDELDAARVGDAGHAHARVAGLVELRLGLLGEPVDQRRDVAALGVGRVDRDRAAASCRSRGESQVRTLKPALRSAPTPTLPVVSSLVASGSVCARAAPAVALEDRRRLPAAGRGVEGEHDLGAVEGGDGGVAGLGGGGAARRRRGRAARTRERMAPRWYPDLPSSS